MCTQHPLYFFIERSFLQIKLVMRSLILEETAAGREIYLRVTINGKHFDVSTESYI